MSHDLCTVQDVADRLGLHPKTVLRFIREGRLRAKRLGKSYRILRSDLEAFAGIPANTAPTEGASVTSIVEIPDVSPELARKWARTVANALQAKPAGSAMQAQVIHEPEHARVKIILVGAPGDTVNLLSLIRVWIEQLRP
jgi:excisionase family DNA binding protein